MGSLKRSSRALERAKLRLGALISIDPKLDLGNGLTAAAYKDEITSLETELEGYNDQLAVADSKRSDLTLSEKDMNDLSERMLSAVGVKYGRDSAEYQKAGGVRKSARKRRAPAAKKLSPA